MESLSGLIDFVVSMTKVKGGWMRCNGEMYSQFITVEFWVCGCDMGFGNIFQKFAQNLQARLGRWLLAAAAKEDDISSRARGKRGEEVTRA